MEPRGDRSSAPRPRSGGGRRTGGTAKGGGVLPLPLDGFRIALFLLLVLTLSRIHQHFEPLAALSPALVLAGLTVLFGVGSSRRLTPGQTLDRWPAQVMAALGILACLTVPFALSMGASAAFVVRYYSKVLVVAFLLVAAIHSTRDLRFFVWGLVLSAGILAWMAIFVFELQPTAPEGGMRRLNNMYTYDANDMGCVLLVALPLTLLTFQTSKKWGKVVSVLVLAGIGLAVARSGSRGAFVGLAAVLVALLFWVRRISLTRRLGVLALIGSVVLVAAPQGYWDQMATLTNLDEDYNVTSPEGRLALAKRGAGYMLDNPAVGLGVGNFPRAEGTISRRARNFVPDTDRSLEWLAPHNSYIQAGAEMGVPGLLLWTGLVLGGILGIRRLARRIPERWESSDDPEEEFLHLATVYLPVAIIGFAVTANFVSFAYMDVVYVLGAFVCGTYRCVDRALEAEGEETGGEARPRGRGVPAAVAISPPPTLGRRTRRPVGQGSAAGDGRPAASRSGTTDGSQP